MGAPENVKFGSYFANFKINCLLSWTHHTLFMKMMLRRAKVQGIRKYFKSFQEKYSVTRLFTPIMWYIPL